MFIQRRPGRLCRALASAVVLVAVPLTNRMCELRARAQPRASAIHDIQGPGARSPLAGELVIASGIVTGRKSNGFFIQTPSDAADANPNTSEGLFVFTGAAPAPNLTPGTLVSVGGRVLEFIPAADPSSPPLTEIAEVSSIEVRGAGATLPAPIEIAASDILPNAGHGQLERLEGMRVRIAALTMISPTLGAVNESNAAGTSNGVFYGVIGGLARPFREPGIDVHHPLPAGAPCCVPRFDGNPERIRVDSDGQPGAAAIDAPSGTVVENLIGPLDYGFQSYTILPDPSTPPRVTAGPAANGARARRPQTNTSSPRSTCNASSMRPTTPRSRSPYSRPPHFRGASRRRRCTFADARTCRSLSASRKWRTSQRWGRSRRRSIVRRARHGN